MPTTYKGKLVIVGDIAVGKTSLLSRFVYGKFYADQRSSIGVAYSTKTVTVKDNIIKLDIWDTAGQERFRSISSLFYRGSGAALIVYDITDKKSLQTVKTEWLKAIRQYAVDNVTIALAGNKLDMADRRQVSREEAEEFAKENGLIHIETSAKTGDGVDEIFRAIANQVPKLVESSQTRETCGFKIIRAAPRRISRDAEGDGCAC